MISGKSREEIIARDLSEILLINDEEKLWIQELSGHLETQSLTIRLTQNIIEEEPIIEFRSGKWYAGRYVGDLHYKGRMLRIIPRYETSFYRWISKIWGVRLTNSHGSYRKSSHWLWLLMSKLWGDELIRGAKHGMPTYRVEETYTGTMLRGRMKVIDTVLNVGKGQNTLVSKTRIKAIDPGISSILLLAYGRIRKELGHHDDHHWLSERGRELMGRLKQALPQIDTNIQKIKHSIRYTPISESYRSVVQLSLNLLSQKPMGNSTVGNQVIYGTLLDMAEVWELYVYQLIKTSLIGVEIQHTGRQNGASAHLYHSTNGRKIGALKPDILINHYITKQVLAVVDAKYKHTFSSSTKPTGLERNDLYQIHAYMNAFSNHFGSICGILVYPNEAGGQIGIHQSGNPWNVATTGNSLRFYGISGEEEGNTDLLHLTPLEEQFCKELQTLFLRKEEIVNG